MQSTEFDHTTHSGFVVSKLATVVNELQIRSLWPAGMGLACCAIEFMMGGAPDYDYSRFGMEVYRASPRQADLMVVSGRLSQKMVPVLRQCYDQMTEPKWVIAMGACANSGGMFNNYAIVQGIDHVVPVDVYLPGCPPRPEMLIDSYLKLHALILAGAPFGEDRNRIRKEVEAAALAAVPLSEMPLEQRLITLGDVVGV